VLAAEVDAQSFGCVGEAEATYGWGLLLLLLLFLLLLLGVVVVEGDHCDTKCRITHEKNEPTCNQICNQNHTDETKLNTVPRDL